MKEFLGTKLAGCNNYVGAGMETFSTYGTGTEIDNSPLPKLAALLNVVLPTNG
jgi:hypothetical protein